MAKFRLGQVEAKVRVEFGPLMFWSKLLITEALTTFCPDPFAVATPTEHARAAIKQLLNLIKPPRLV